MTLHDTPYSWLRLFLSVLIAIIGNVGMWAIVVVMPTMQTELAVDRGNASLPYTMTMVGFALGNYLIGRFVDRFGIVWTLIFASCINAGSFWAISVSPNLFWISVFQMALGFGTAATFGPLIADVSQWFLRRRGIAVAIAASGNYLSGAIWPMALSGIMLDGGWRDVYEILAVLCLAIMIPLSLLLRRSIDQASVARSDQLSESRLASLPVSTNSLIWLLGIAGIGCCVAMSMPQVHIVAYCVDLGYGPAVGAEMLSLMLLGGVVSRLIAGAFSDKLGGLKTLLISSSLQCLGLILFLPYDGLVSLYVVSALFGLSQGGIVPSYAIIVREYLPSKRAGEQVGFVLMATIVGMALGGWMSGWIYEVGGSYFWAFLNGIGWNILNIAIVGFLTWRAAVVMRSIAA
jgi:MFS family permease